MSHFPKIFAIVVLSTLSVVACSNKEEPSGVIPKGHLEAVEKTNDVEVLLQDAAKKKLEDLDAG